MLPAKALTQKALAEFLLHVAVIRPVFIWGPPGIGKSAIVQQFARQVGLPCVSLLGSQLAPEDLIGVPQIVDGKSRFCPPTMLAVIPIACSSTSCNAVRTRSRRRSTASSTSAASASTSARARSSAPATGPRTPRSSGPCPRP